MLSSVALWPCRTLLYNFCCRGCGFLCHLWATIQEDALELVIDCCQSRMMRWIIFGVRQARIQHLYFLLHPHHFPHQEYLLWYSILQNLSEAFSWWGLRLVICFDSSRCWRMEIQMNRKMNSLVFLVRPALCSLDGTVFWGMLGGPDPNVHLYNRIFSADGWPFLCCYS